MYENLKCCLKTHKDPRRWRLKCQRKNDKKTGRASHISLFLFIFFSLLISSSFRLKVDFTAHMDCVLHWFMNYSFLLALFSMNQFTKVVLCSRITLTSSILYCRDRFHFSYRYVPFFLSQMFSVNWLNQSELQCRY